MSAVRGHIMNNKEKRDILIFAQKSFRQFYADNYIFLSDSKYKPGKRTYRNLLSLNKFMKCYLYFGHDYVDKREVISYMGWPGSSSYVQHERIITNFGLSDTSWQDRDREVLLLNDDGKKLRDRYKKYCKDNPHIDLATLNELPDFAIKYLVAQLKNTTSQNMTLWKNTIITALFMYSTLGYIPRYSSNTKSVATREKQAFKDCLNYVKNGVLQDVTYTDQPIAMLKNLRLLDSKGKLTTSGYNLLKTMQLFSETESAYGDYLECFEGNVFEAAEILSENVVMSKVSTPTRKNRKSIVKTSSTPKRPVIRDFAKEADMSLRIGKLGEQLALVYERRKMYELGVTDVEDKVFLTAEHPDYGNAYPCDLISIDPITGEKIFIEIKATKRGVDSAFYISKEELAFSLENQDNYRLYRIYNVLNNESGPEFYETEGYVGDNFSLIADRFIAIRDVIVDDE